jgi:hypothetical protein
MKATLRSMLMGVLALVGSAGALAQATVAADVPDAATAACLTPKSHEGTKVLYPTDLLDSKSDGIVRLRMEFFDADMPPRASVLYSSAEAFEQAARKRVRDYRLPCLKAGAAPVVLLQEFSFDPRDGRRVMVADPQALEIRANCVLEGINPSELAYPARAMQNGVTGSVLVQARFEASGQAPSSVTVLNPAPAILAFAASEHMKGARLVCKEPSGTWPKSALQGFKFHIENSATVRLKDLSFVQFLGLVDKIETQRVRFDLNSMACPFELEWVLHRPYAENGVGEVGQTDPNRQALLAWLRDVELRIPLVTLNQVLGDTIRITVPCGLVDLTS